MLFCNFFSVPNDIDRNIFIKITEYVEIDVDRRIDFDDILPAHLSAFHIFDNCDAAVQLVKTQITI